MVAEGPHRSFDRENIAALLLDEKPEAILIYDGVLNSFHSGFDKGGRARIPHVSYEGA
jgi:hypothetical protein